MNTDTEIKAENRKVFAEGLRDGLPIGLGYLAVSFSLGIAARNAGLTAVQGFITSILVIASAGEFAGFTAIAENVSYIQMAFVILVANARYLLMSSAMSQRLSSETKFRHRLCMAFSVTDELFAIAIVRPGNLNPLYTYGATVSAVPLWAIGTTLGILAGNLLPVRIVSAFSVALYGMFFAVIFPAARKDKIIAGIIAVCFALSFVFSRWSLLSDISSGGKTIILTIVISAAAALIFPRREDEENEA